MLKVVILRLKYKFDFLGCNRARLAEFELKLGICLIFKVILIRILFLFNWDNIFFFYDRTINTDDLLYNHKVNVE
jgi:hypothetical protein